MSQMRAVVDKLLTGVSSAYIPKGFISEQVLPTIKSKQYSGLLGKYGTNHLRIENSVKGGRGKYRQIETRVYSTTGFLIEGHGLEGFVSKEDYANVYEPFDAERDEVMGLSTVLWLEKKRHWRTRFFRPARSRKTCRCRVPRSSATTQTRMCSEWSRLRRDTILNSTGVQPNLCIMDVYVYNVLRFHPQLLDALGFKWDRPGGMQESEMARALGVDQVLFGSARYESAKEGQASSLAAVWGKGIVFAVSPDKAAIMQKSVGYLVTPDGSQPRKVYKESNFNPPGSTKILCEDEYDMLISDANCAYLIATAVA